MPFFLVPQANGQDDTRIPHPPSLQTGICACVSHAPFWFRGKLIVFLLFVLHPTPLPLSHCAICPVVIPPLCCIIFASRQNIGIFFLVSFFANRQNELEFSYCIISASGQNLLEFSYCSTSQKQRNSSRGSSSVV